MHNDRLNVGVAPCESLYKYITLVFSDTIVYRTQGAHVARYGIERDIAPEQPFLIILKHIGGYILHLDIVAFKECEKRTYGSIIICGSAERTAVTCIGNFFFYACDK